MALVAFGRRFQREWSASAAYPADLRARVLAAQEPGTKLAIRELLALDRDLGEWIGRTVGRALGSKTPRADLVAVHGQTVAHFPAAGRKGLNLQLGDPTRIAWATGLSVVSVFRNGDQASGGQGAPLVPIYHLELARELGAGAVSIHNLGGIGNLTYCRSGHSPIAFDTGPANLWIDGSVALATGGRAKMDRGGRRALAGRVDELAVRRVLAWSFFTKRPPKSTGRDQFPMASLLQMTRARGNDLVATATEIAARSVALAYERWILARALPLERVVFCGGGARNPILIGRIRELLRGIPVSTAEDVGWASERIEAEAFAYLGVLALHGASMGGSWTGGAPRAPSAHLVPGANWGRLLAKMGRIAWRGGRRVIARAQAEMIR